MEHSKFWQALQNLHSAGVWIIFVENVEAMSNLEKIQLFENKKIRAAWDEDEEKWYFSVVDVCGVLTDQPTPKRASTYWAVFTDEWKARGIDKEKDYAILTNELTKAWSGLSVREYKDLKGLKKENLRDNMTDIELVLNMLAEVSTKAISQAKQPTTFGQSKRIGNRRSRD